MSRAASVNTTKLPAVSHPHRMCNGYLMSTDPLRGNLTRACTNELVTLDHDPHLQGLRISHRRRDLARRE